MSRYQKPENILRRADELLQVSQPLSALILLHEMILSKRARTTPLPILEGIVLKFIEIAVTLGKGKMAREVLYQYKNIAQNVVVGTIEVVIKKFLIAAESKLDDALKKVKLLQMTACDGGYCLIVDLEAEETPEHIIMSTVSAEDSKDRTDRQLVTPGLRFMWEAYRTALDTIRNNVKLEVLYQHVANNAFQFCLKYERKVEFRRLCDMLRSHLTSHAKHAHLSHTIDLNDPDTLQRHLDTRFTQLNVAAKLEHWCEGFRSVEDIFQLIEVSHKAPKAYMMASYYKHLSKILMVGDNFLFHAAAYSGYFTIMRQNKNLAQEEFDLMANLCLISALAIPIIKLGSRGASDHDEKVKNHKLTFLLRASKVPTREALLKDALSFSPNISADALELYKILESRFHPLQICQKIAPIMERFTKDSYLSGYVKPLHQVVLSRLLKQLSQVYTTIKIESVVSLAMFPAPYKYSSHDIEKFVMQGCKRGEFFIRIHHSTQTLNFECNDEGNPTINALSRNALPADALNYRLKDFSDGLYLATSIIFPSQVQSIKDNRLKAFKEAVENIDKDREAAYMQKMLIQKKKELQTEELAKQELIRKENATAAAIADALKLEAGNKRREHERMLAQRKKIEQHEAQKMAEKLAETLLGKNVKMDPAELANLDTAKLIELQMQQLEKERNDLVSKTKSTAKRMDHLERALRKVEIPLLKIDYETQQKQDRDNYELKKKVGIEYAKAKHKQDIFTKEKKQLDGVRDEQFKVLKAESSVKFESAKKKLIAERQAKKISDQKKTEEEAQREDKQRAEDAIRRELEDAERAGTDAKRDEMFKKQQERERLAEEKIAAAKSTNAAASGSWTVPKPSSSSGAGSSRPTVRDAAAPSDGAPEIWKPSGVSWRDKASVTPTPFHGSRPAPTNGSTFGSGRTNSGATTPHNTATRENPFGNASARAPIQKSNPPSASSSPPSTGPHKYVHPNRLKKDGVGKKE